MPKPKIDKLELLKRKNAKKMKKKASAEIQMSQIKTLHFRRFHRFPLITFLSTRR